MCCPLYPVHLVFSYGAIVIVTWILAGSAMASAAPSLSPRLALNKSLVTSLALTEGRQTDYTFYLDDIPDDYVGELMVQVSSGDNLQHLLIEPSTFPVNRNVTTSDPPPDYPPLVVQGNTTDGEDAPSGGGGRYLQGEFTATGSFLGFANVKFVLSDGDDKEMMESAPVAVKVDRGEHVLDKIFVHIVILMVVFIYINMGCTIDLAVIKTTLRRPVAPLIGLVSQYLFMPLCSYLLGYLFLSHSPSLRLGLFVTGCCPGGGGSNVWTYLLGGSLDLSVTMTFVSTVAAFVCMPAWLWALAPTIYAEGQFDRPPFRNIAMLVLGLIVPISLGLALKRFCPRGAALLKRLLKPLSLFFIVFVMTFGIYAYWFIFAFFTWQVALCGLCLPLMGFVAGWAASTMSGRGPLDVTAITIETGLQNTGLAIGLLKVALSSFSPLGDIAMVVPIAVATLTPVPLATAYAVMQFNLWRSRRDDDVGAKKNSDKDYKETTAINIDADGIRSSGNSTDNLTIVDGKGGTSCVAS